MADPQTTINLPFSPEDVATGKLPGASDSMQDIGYEFGCPAGVRITDWLRITLRKAKQADAEIKRLRDALEYVDGQFAIEAWVCPRCAYSDPADGCDSHLYVREVLNHGK